ncbi:MAG: hypothetical protein PHI59_00415 [Candidatus Omnitrophica bacterium]|nr:hypothetical protein [Candidatus Omnitrophota bacterium]
MAKCNKITVSFLFLLLAAVLINPVYAATIEVHPGESIQNAINQASSGDEVFIFSGLYAEDILMKDGVDLTGESYNLVIINGRISFQDASSTIKDVTIIFPEGNFLTYTNTYYDGFSLQDDAGITIINSVPVIQGCLITPDLDSIISTPEYYGKGIQIWNMYHNPDASPDITNNIIIDTECGIYYFSQVFGGAILGQIKNNTLYHNRDGIVLRMHKEKPEIKNNIIIGGESGLFLTYGDGALFNERKTLVHHNDIWVSTDKYWLDEGSSEFDLTGISGNISADPIFADPNNYDFTLATGSPCIGQGDDGGDMGAQLTAPSAPSVPQIEPLPSITNQRYITIEGAKDANSSIIINGEESVSLNSETTWIILFYDLGADGAKVLSISSKNIYGQESSTVTVNITLDTIPPEVVITSPLDGAIFDTAPITVSGTISEESDVIVNGVLATIDGNNFTAENVDLRYGENTITATAYDLAGNTASDIITVNSTTTSDCNITKVSTDVYEYDPTQIVAGAQVSLTVRLEIDGKPVENEPIEYRIMQGAGSMVQSAVNTNANGEATGIFDTDINASVTNLIEVFDQNFPTKKVTFHIDTKEGIPSNLAKVTDDSIYPVPGTGVDLIVKLEDANANPVPDSEIGYQIISGSGTLSSTADITNDYGNAHIVLTTTSSQGTLCVVEARVTSNPDINTTFNITTSSFPPVTVNDIMAKVAANDQLIQDVMADITVTSNAPWAPPVAQLKIWQKGDKQKVQEISPKPGIYIRPATDTGTAVNMVRTILFYNLATDIYTIKSIQQDQTEEYPYQIDCVDYGKGVITKSERHIKDGDYIGFFISEYTNFINIGGIWGFQTMTEAAYDEAGNQLYTTTSSYSNIQLNTSIPDSVFE